MSHTDDLQNKIEEQYEFVQEANYYEILEVDESAETDDITRHFRTLAKKWHIDRFSGEDLDEETKQKLREIFSEIQQAHDTLKNAESREKYDVSLEADADDSAGIESVIDAEDSFRKGRNLLDAGRYEGAHKYFERACERMPADRPKYRGHHVYAKFLMLPKEKDGTPRDVERARELFGKLESISNELADEEGWIFAFMGSVASAIGETTRAKGLFQNAKRLDPDNRMAERQLRLLERRSEQDDDEGVLDQLGDVSLNLSVNLDDLDNPLDDVSMDADSWLTPSWTSTITLGIVLVLVVVVYGFMSPYAFTEQLHLGWGGSIDEIDEQTLVLPRQEEAAAGFFQNARFPVGGSGSLVSADRKLATLEATSPYDVTIEAAEGVKLEQVDDDGEVVRTVADGETLMVRGKIYRVGDLYLRIRRLIQ